MIETDGKRCTLNPSGQVVQNTIGKKEIMKINQHQIVSVVDYSSVDDPNTDLVLCSRFIGFIVDKGSV